MVSINHAITILFLDVFGMTCQSQSCRKILKTTDLKWFLGPGSPTELESRSRPLWLALAAKIPITGKVIKKWMTKWRRSSQFWLPEAISTGLLVRTCMIGRYTVKYIYTYIYIYIYIYTYPWSVNHLQCKSGGLQTSGMPKIYRHPFWDVLTLLTTDLDKMYQIKYGGYQMNTTCIYIYIQHIYIYTLYINIYIYIYIYNYIYISMTWKKRGDALRFTCKKTIPFYGARLVRMPNGRSW